LWVCQGLTPRKCGAETPGPRWISHPLFYQLRALRRHAGSGSVSSLRVIRSPSAS
jgi:hypothetical protein